MDWHFTLHGRAVFTLALHLPASCLGGIQSSPIVAPSWGRVGRIIYLGQGQEGGVLSVGALLANQGMTEQRAEGADRCRMLQPIIFCISHPQDPF